MKARPVISAFKMPTLGEFLNRFIPRIERREQGVYYYGTENKLPQEIIQLAGGNAALTKALRLRAKYMFAKGFADEKSANFIVDPEKGTTANQLLQQITFPKSLFGGISLYVKKSANGKIGVEPTAHELIRRRLDGDFEVNAYWGQQQYRKNDSVTYAAFGSGKSYKKDGKILGEILYYWNRDAISYHYPIPDWFAGEMDVRTSSELAALDLEMAVNSFMTSGILTLVGDALDESRDGEDGMSAFDMVASELNKFTGGVKNTGTGLSDRNRMLLLTAPNRDSVPVLQQFNVEKIISGSIEKREAVDRLIALNCGVNPVLLGYDAATTLGNTQALANASEQLVKHVTGDQEDIKAVFTMLFPGMDWTISQFNPIQYIPSEVFQKMTDDEIRDLAGLPPIEKSTPSDSEKVLQTLSTLSPLLSAEIVKRMGDQDLFDLIGFKSSTK